MVSTQNQQSNAVRHRATAPPAVLGGTPAFPAPLAFCRPTRPTLDAVAARVAPSYDQGILTNGPLVAELEERIADRLGVAHVVAVSSCTAGLVLALQALLVDRPGPVVQPSFTFSASVHAVAWNGRTSRFADCLPDSYQIDLDHAARLLDGAAALMPTHIFGAPADPKGVEDLARTFDVPVLFDAAHALGSTASGTPIGRFGDIEVFSLTPTKVLVAGEGGLVATSDPDLAAHVRLGRNYGDPGDYNTQFVGLNARMSEIHAATALESLRHFDDTLARRAALAEQYRTALVEIPGIAVQAVGPGDESTFKDLSIRIDPDTFGITRDQLRACLSAEGIDTRCYFDPPVHRHDAYAHLDPVDLPVTDAVCDTVISLPIYLDLGPTDVERVVDAVHRAHVHAEAVRAVIPSTPNGADQ